MHPIEAAELLVMETWAVRHTIDVLVLGKSEKTNEEKPVKVIDPLQARLEDQLAYQLMQAKPGLFYGALYKSHDKNLPYHKNGSLLAVLADLQTAALKFDDYMPWDILGTCRCDNGDIRLNGKNGLRYDPWLVNVVSGHEGFHMNGIHSEYVAHARDEDAAEGTFPSIGPVYRQHDTRTQHSPRYVLPCDDRYCGHC